MASAISVWLGIGFVGLGGVNVWLVLEAWSRVKVAKASARMLALHRIGGYLFIAVFCAMTWFMVARLRGGGAENSAAVTMHLGLAMVLSPLLFVKVLIARYYRNQHNLLLPIGLTIFVLAFVLIASTAGPYLARESTAERVSIDPARATAVTIDLNQAGDLMQRRCSKCHNLDRAGGGNFRERSACKTRLLEGQVSMTTESGLDAESKARGFVLTCVGHAAGNVRLDA